MSRTSKLHFPPLFSPQSEIHSSVTMDGDGSGLAFLGQEPILVSATQDEALEPAPRSLHASTAPTLAVVPLAESQALHHSSSGPGTAARSGPYSNHTHGPTIADLFSALHDLQASMFTMQASHRGLQASLSDLQHRVEDMQRHLSHLDRRVTQHREQVDELDNSNFNAHVRITDTAADMRELGRTVQDLQDRHAQLNTNQVQLQRRIGHALHLTGAHLLNQQ